MELVDRRFLGRFVELAKKKRSQKGSRKAKQINRRPFTEAQKSATADWLGHMCRHLERAIALSEQLDEVQLEEDNHQFWALVKYAENVQECIIQLDNLNQTILPALDEVPLDPVPGSNFSWSGMKGMRQRLAHDFRGIDPEILWKTVTKDFPVLLSLVSQIYLGEKSGAASGTLRFKAGVWRKLPPFERKEGPMPGNTVVGLFFDEAGKAQCLRFGRIDDRTVTFSSSGGMEITKLRTSLIDDDGSVEELGGWSANHVGQRPS